MCTIRNCFESATHGPFFGSATHCERHIYPGLIKQTNEICNIKGCIEIATQGYNNIPNRCEEHKTPTMKACEYAIKERSVRQWKYSLYCNVEKCTKRGVIKSKDDPPIRWCARHAPRELKPKCIVADCNFMPKYRHEEDSKPTLCSTHAKPGMINTGHNLCEHCNLIGTFKVDYYDNKVYCATHKPENAVRRKFLKK